MSNAQNEETRPFCFQCMDDSWLFHSSSSFSYLILPTFFFVKENAAVQHFDEHGPPFFPQFASPSLPHAVSSSSIRSQKRMAWTISLKRYPSEAPCCVPSGRLSIISLVPSRWNTNQKRRRIDERHLLLIHIDNNKIKEEYHI